MLGAATVKLSAAALLMVTVIILLLRLDWRQRVVLAIGSAIVLLPSIASSYLATGCLLYPFYLSCAAPDWALGPDNARRMVRAITGFGQWGPSVPPDAGAWNWIPGWPLRRLSNVMFTLLLGLSLIAALVQWRVITRSPAVRHVAILAAAGMGYVLLTSPEIRFGIGVLAILPALLVGTCCSKRAHAKRTRSRPTRGDSRGARCNSLSPDGARGSGRDEHLPAGAGAVQSQPASRGWRGAALALAAARHAARQADRFGPGLFRSRDQAGLCGAAVGRCGLLYPGSDRSLLECSASLHDRNGLHRSQAT